MSQAATDGLTETLVDSRRLYEGKIINVRLDTVRLPDGRHATREVVEHSQAVAVVALTDDDGVVLVRQYRHPVGEITLEVPAGKLDKGENPLECAVRELEEETGYRASDIRRVMSFYTTPGFSDELIHIFVARGISRYRPHPDQDEFVKAEVYSLDQAVDMIRSGVIRDAKTIAGILSVGSGLV
ncbi:MAG TPA: NUDIX hydrolase [Firmicutes bacterium]|nr:NUDIX hydrolase [Bacillota bacterium]